MLLAVYGTLRTGQALSYLLAHYRKKSNVTIEEVTNVILYVVGACPAAKMALAKDKAVIELWDMNLTKSEEYRLLTVLDRVEGVADGLYLRGSVTTSKGKAVMYYFRGGVSGCVKITDWMEFIKMPNKYKEDAYYSSAKAGAIMVEFRNF